MSVDTENKIKEAARKLFREKGYAATRTRNIAEDAGINLALLNYYFKSKEQLFKIIMMEEFEKFFNALFVNINNKEMPLREKLITIAKQYFATMKEEQELPTFIISEVHVNPEYILDFLLLKKNLMESHLLAQFREIGYSEDEILNRILNLLSLILFPFISKPVYTKVFDFDEEHYLKFMENRERQIPNWIDNLILN
ncbi:MAG TPA: TetR family transcriptional regulator [Paludibacteraceae bacterium]|mgnify:FL=1|nr:TetR family transcriptional regulator [Paludibacteraceae bacterium]HQF50363.1 TetR family transcriptional regulator [Paludibacteraceae bacterium]HQJ89239.1 TetR family transcriptional regulator [Paludibacteraceae bacterium]